MKDIYERALDALLFRGKVLTPDEMVELGERMDGDPNDGLLEQVNVWLEKNRPEVFVSAGKVTSDCG